MTILTDRSIYPEQNAQTLTPLYMSPYVYFHALTHLSFIYMVLGLGLKEWLVSLFVYFLFACLGVACTFHRLVAHKSYQAPKWFEILGMILGTLSGVGSSIQWAAVHRAHHRFSDTERDPHNPKGRFWQMQFFAMLVPASPRYVTDLIRSPLHQFFHRFYWLFHALYALALAMLIEPMAIIYAHLVPSFAVWHIMSALGTFAHTERFGYQMKGAELTDRSRNLWLPGWLAFGEGWHSNHHNYPSRWRFGIEPFEVDLSARIIQLIKID